MRPRLRSARPRGPGDLGWVCSVAGPASRGAFVARDGDPTRWGMLVAACLCEWGVLLAQQAPDAGPGLLGGLTSMLPMFLILMVLYYFMIAQPQRRDQEARQDMLKNLKKNDRVLTTGGIYGIVTNVQADANEVTIRVDEKTDTKLRLTLAAIERRLDEATSSETDKGGK